jgi:hypothetical protein
VSILSTLATVLFGFAITTLLNRFVLGTIVRRILSWRLAVLMSGLLWLCVGLLAMALVLTPSQGLLILIAWLLGFLVLALGIGLYWRRHAPDSHSS